MNENRFKIEPEREKLYPGLGLELGSLAVGVSALTMRYSGQVLIHDRINLLLLSFLTSGPTNSVIIMHSQTLE